MKIDYWKLIDKAFTESERFSVHFSTLKGYHTNPFRKDRNPGCRFRKKNGKLVFQDFAWADSPIGNRPMDANTFLKLYFETNDPKKILEKLTELKKKGLLKKLEFTGKAGRGSRKTKGGNDSEHFLVAEIEEWNEDNRGYWLQYGIDNFYVAKQKELRHIVLPIKSFIMDDNNYNKDGYLYVYHNAKKVYMPGRKPKFIGYATEHDIAGKFIPDSTEVFLTKSLKDFEVLRRVLPKKSILYMQGESMFPTEEQIQKYFKDRTVILLYDNDEAGKKAVQRLEEYLMEFVYHINHIFPTEKDWADMALKNKWNEMKKLLISI